MLSNTNDYNAGATAIARKTMSLPLRDALLIQGTGVGTRRSARLDHQLSSSPWPRWLDFGCGKGQDVRTLRAKGFAAEGWDLHDPEWFARPPGLFDIVMMTYVVNVIPDPVPAILDAASFLAPGGTLVVTTRTTREVDRQAEKSGWKPHGRGGWITHKGTYQAGYRPYELKTTLSLVAQKSAPHVRLLTRDLHHSTGRPYTQATLVRQ